MSKQAFILTDMDKYDFMRLALEQARLSADEGEVPVGAVVVRNGEVVSYGRNRREKEKNALCHAEIEAIDKACKALGGWRLWECEMYVTLEPCMMCTGAIIQSRLKKIYIGTRDIKGGSIESSIEIKKVRNINHYPDYEIGILEDECSKILKDFFKEKRNKK